MPKKVDKPRKKLRKLIAKQLQQLSEAQKLEILGLRKKALRRRIKETSGSSVKKLRIDGRPAKKKCCDRSLHEMCGRCPRRYLLEVEIAKAREGGRRKTA